MNSFNTSPTPRTVTPPAAHAARPGRARRSLGLGFTIALTFSFAFAGFGCAAAGWVADGVTPATRTVNVEAEYLGLEDQRIAVLVDTDLDVALTQPLAQLEVATAISNRIAGHVPGVTVLEPREVIQFQQNNLYWNTAPYSQIMDRLEVDRLVLIELVDYRLHEPGNVNVWRGRMTGNIGVAEADADRPDDQAYATTVAVEYPPDSEVGLLNADQRTIRLATLEMFSRATAGKFYDHQRQRDNRR